MARPILERIRDWFRPKPSPFAPIPTRSLRESLEGKEILPANPGQIPYEPPKMPEGVDLSALWEEADESSSLAMILNGATLAIVVILFLMKLFGK